MDIQDFMWPAIKVQSGMYTSFNTGVSDQGETDRPLKERVEK